MKKIIFSLVLVSFFLLAGTVARAQVGMMGNYKQYGSAAYVPMMSGYNQGSHNSRHSMMNGSDSANSMNPMMGSISSENSMMGQQRGYGTNANSMMSLSSQ